MQPDQLVAEIERVAEETETSLKVEGPAVAAVRMAIGLLRLTAKLAHDAHARGAF